MAELTTSTVRVARMEDAAVLADLAAELGYAKSAAEMAASLVSLLPRQDHVVLVAQRDGSVLGWLHASEREALESPRRLEIMGLVVAETARGQGLGAQLMAVAEQWGRARGLEIVQLRTNIKRTEAHRFYARLGYQTTKTSLTLQKSLQPG